MAGSTDVTLAPGIVTNPERRDGRPTLAGTRITVEEVLDRLAGGWSVDDLLRDWPHVTRAKLELALAFAAQVMRAYTPASGAHGVGGR